MRVTFNDDDIARWQERNGAHLDILRETMDRGDLRAGRQVTQAARVHEYLGLTAIARGEYGRARGHFGAAAEAWANIFERAQRGEDIDASLTAIVPPGVVLLANAGTERAVQRLAAATARVGAAAPKGSASNYLGGLLRLLSLGAVDEAGSLLRVAPKTPKHQESSLRAVRAIVSADEGEFVSAMKDEVAFWEKTIKREQLQRHPDAVCFDHGLGWAALAERVWRRPIDLSIEQIPIAVLREEPDVIEAGV